LNTTGLYSVIKSRNKQAA